LVIGLPVFLSAFYPTDAQALITNVDHHHFIADFDLNVLLFFKFPGRPGDQALDVADNLADVIGNASSGIGREGSSLTGDNFKLLILSTGLRSSAPTGRVTADNKNALFCHSLYFNQDNFVGWFFP
jgi:hypothetical protein